MEQMRFTAKPLNRQIIINIPPEMDAEVVEVLVRATKKTPPNPSFLLIVRHADII
jgi:hypothetical protein